MPTLNPAGPQYVYTGHNLKLLRKHLGVTQQQLGNMLGLPRATINTYEGGSNPSFKVTVHICQKFGFDINRFTMFKATHPDQLKVAVPQSSLQQAHQTQMQALEQASAPELKQAYSQLLHQYLHLKMHVQAGLQSPLPETGFSSPPATATT